MGRWHGRLILEAYLYAYLYNTLSYSHTSATTEAQQGTRRKGTKATPPSASGIRRYGAVPVEGGVVRIGRPQCPMLNGRCPGAGSDAAEVWVVEYDRKANILFVPTNVVLPRVILYCRRRMMREMVDAMPSMWNIPLA